MNIRRAMGWSCLSLLLSLTAAMADAVVDSTSDVVADDGVTTLREALEIGGAITFSPAVFSTPQTIVLSSQLNAGNGLGLGSRGVYGPGKSLLTIQGNVECGILEDLTIDGVVSTAFFGVLRRCDVRGGVLGRSVQIDSLRTGELTMEDCEVYSGSGISVDSHCRCTLLRTKAYGNRGDGFHFAGAGTVTLTVTGCEFTDNGGRGISHIDTGPMDFWWSVIRNCTISNNRGGGVYHAVERMQSLSLSNCIISGNHTDGNGGGVSCIAYQDGPNPELSLSGCIIVGNSAGGMGGGVYGDVGGWIDLGGCIVAGNVNSAGEPSDLATDFPHWDFPPLEPFVPAIRATGCFFSDPAGIPIPLFRESAHSTDHLLVEHGVNGNVIGRDDGAGGRERVPVAEVVQPLSDYGDRLKTHDAVPGSLAIGFGGLQYSGDGDADGLTDAWEIARGHDHLSSASPAPDTLLLHYQFENASGEKIENVAPGAAGWGDGRLNSLDAAAALGIPPPSPSPAGGMVLYCDKTQAEDATYVSSGLLSGQLGALGDYTMSAWICVSEFVTGTGQDDMNVFGQPEDNVLHHGVRGESLWQGHWNNDHSSAPFTLEARRWYHVAWRYAGDQQSMHVDGVEVSNALKGPLANAGEILIGTSKVGAPWGYWNDRDFQGWIDDVRIYVGALSEAQIAALAIPLDHDTDSDGDGQSDQAEGIAGTDPHDPLSYLHVTSVTFPGLGVRIEWSAVEGKTYRLECSSDLRRWAKVTELTARAGDESLGYVSYRRAHPDSVETFYRVRVFP